jgi:hypothetical protein
MARTEEVEVLREVASALNCLTSMEGNKEEVSDRAMSSVIAMLLSGDTEVERHATCAVANLMENVDLHVRLLEERGLPPLVRCSAAPCLPLCRPASLLRALSLFLSLSFSLSHPLSLFLSLTLSLFMPLPPLN